MPEHAALSESALVELSRSLEKQRKLPELEEVLRRLVGQNPASVEHRKRLGWTLLAAGKVDEAGQTFGAAKAVAGPADQAEIRLGQGLTAARLKHWREAVPLLTEALSLGAPQARAPLLLALKAVGDFAQALKISEEMLRAEPQNPKIIVQHARYLAYVGRFGEAATILAKAIQNGPTDQETTQLLVQLLVAAGNLTGASQVLAQLLKHNFEYHPGQILWAECLKQGYSAPDAEAFLRTLIAADKQHAAALYQLALLLERRGDFGQAAPFADASAALQPKSPLLAGLRGRLAILRGHDQEAIVLFAQAYDFVVQRVRAPATDSDVQPSSAVGPALQPIVYLPVEVSSRELVSRLVLAHLAVNAGFVVVLLGHIILRGAWRLPPGVIVNKGVNAFDRPFIASVSAAGHVFTAIDEEAFGWTGPAYSMLRTIDVRNLASTAALFAPGQAYANLIGAEVPEARGRMVVAGNPRTDLLRPQFATLFAADAEAVRKQFGPTILVCTNLGGWNSGTHPPGMVFHMDLEIPGVDPNSDRGRWLLDVYKDSMTAECRNWRALTEALPALARKFPSHKIVVRPHPVEDSATWIRLAEGHANIVVSNTAGLLPQMLAADVVVHLAGCGTGVESYLVGRPTVCFNVVEDLTYPKLGISAQISRNARTVEELINEVSGAIAREQTRAPNSDAVVAAHVELPQDLVSARIIGHIARLFTERAASAPARNRGKRGDIVQQLVETLEGAKRQADADQFSTPSLRAKRLTTTKAELEDIAGRIGRCIGEGETPRIDSPAEGVFVLW